MFPCTKKNKFRLVFFFRLNFKNKNRIHISRNRHKYMFSRVFGEYKYAWFILVYIFIFHEYILHQIDIKYISAWFNFHGTNTKTDNLFSIFIKNNGHEYKNMSFILDYIIFYQNKRARIQKHVIYSRLHYFF